MHLDAEEIQRVVHRELTPPAEASVREHLAGCAECRGRVTAAERNEAEVDALLRQLDHPVPRVDVAAIEARAAAGRARLGWGRWAAGVLLVLGAAAVAYAVPGTPIPRWVRAVGGWIGGRGSAPQSPELPPETPVTQPEPGGIAVAPGRALLIQFTSSQTEGQARVSLSDGAEVVVRSPGGGREATYSSGVDRLVIDNLGSTARFEIQIPRDAPRVEIRVGERRILLKEGSRVTAEGPEAGGVWLLPLTPR